MKKIQLSLSVEEVNQVMEALSRKPFADVYKLIQNIQQQASAQLQPALEEDGHLENIKNIAHG